MGEKRNTKGQIGVEYLIIIGFVTFAITATLALSYSYIGTSSDRIRMNQVEVFANKIINSAESVYYSGEPSRNTINVHLPNGIKDVSIEKDNVIITLSSSAGEIRRAFPSNVPIEGTISSSQGSKTLLIEAKAEVALVEER